MHGERAGEARLRYLLQSFDFDKSGGSKCARALRCDDRAVTDFAALQLARDFRVELVAIGRAQRLRRIGDRQEFRVGDGRTGKPFSFRISRTALP